MLLKMRVYLGYNLGSMSFVRRQHGGLHGVRARDGGVGRRRVAGVVGRRHAAPHARRLLRRARRHLLRHAPARAHRLRAQGGSPWAMDASGYNIERTFAILIVLLLFSC